MEYAPEEYTRHYIVQALFKLMSENEYAKINVTDIAAKAGVGRATFYRYFKRKEDVIAFYFEHHTKAFVFEQRYYPRCKEDYVEIVTRVLTLFQQNKESFKLLRKARLEYLYLDYLNRNFVATFARDYPENNALSPYLYAGMLFNVSMAWLDGDCAASVRGPKRSSARLCSPDPLGRAVKETGRNARTRAGPAPASAPALGRLPARTLARALFLSETRGKPVSRSTPYAGPGPLLDTRPVRMCPLLWKCRRIKNPNRPHDDSSSER